MDKWDRTMGTNLGVYLVWGAGIGSAIGMSIGVVVGAVTDNIGIWLSMGLVFGAAIGAGLGLLVGAIASQASDEGKAVEDSSESTSEASKE